MGFHIQIVAYGRAAAEALRSTIAKVKGEEPLEPVTVVVPSNHVGVAARRLLASGRLGPCAGRGIGLAAVTFVTPYRLAELLGAPGLADTGRRPVSTPVIAAALRAALEEEPGVFAPVARHPATERALVEAYRELRDLSAGALAAVAAAGARASDVVRLHASARAWLEHDWYDEQDLIASACHRLVCGDGTTSGLGAVVAYLPERWSRHAAMLLVAAAESSEVEVIAAMTGDTRADGEILTSLARLGVGSDLLVPPLKPSSVGLSSLGSERTRIVTASDADDEVRTAVRAIVDAARAGTPLDRIAILHASPEPYARLIHDQLAAAGVAANGAAVLPLTARMAGRCLLELFALPETAFRRQDVFAWLAAGPVRHNGRWAPVAAWERLSREADVVSGREQWDHLLSALADRLDAEAVAADSDPERPPWQAERSHDDARRARSLREFVLGLIDDLEVASGQSRTWGAHGQWGREMLERTLGEARLREQWPAPELAAAERVERALDRLASLDGVEGPVALEVFTRTFRLELESDLGRVGRFGDGVLVGDIAMGAGLDLDLVIVLGMAEGSFPSLVRDDSLLPDVERQAAGGELSLRRHRVDRQHRELLAALAGGAHQTLCMPRGDLRRSSDRVPSRWLLDAASALAGRRLSSADLLALQANWIHHVASFDAGLRAMASPATEQEHRLRSLLSQSQAHARLTTSSDPALASGAAVIAARRSDRFTRFDGNLSGLAIPSPLRGPVSPTSIERWAVCPSAYLLREILRVQTVENPEDELRITALDRGNLMHQAFEVFIQEVLDRPEDEQPGPDDQWTASDRDRMADIGARLCDDYERRGLTGRPIFWRRDRKTILADLQQFLRLDSAHRCLHRTRPLAAELVFGLGGSPTAAAGLELADGRVMHFRGKADRVDVDEDGALHVVDYKTGSTRGFGQLTEEDPDLHGRKLQLPVYGAAARLRAGGSETPVQAEYWFVSTKGKFQRIGYPVTTHVLERVGRTLGTVVAGIEAGVFPPYPTAMSTSWVDCSYCDPDALGVSDLRRQWEHKRGDPAVALYAELVESSETDDDADD
jgi:ATP-dependent helicase/nuclease subunit B